jgi:glyoxylase-like metal-dependent hydrolase (beta-lactamase superfamily II)
LCFYADDEQFLVGGDVLFYQSIGRTDLPGGNHKQLIDSIKNNIFVLPDDCRVYPGHGRYTTIGFEKENNPYLQ